MLAKQEKKKGAETELEVGRPAHTSAFEDMTRKLPLLIQVKSGRGSIDRMWKEGLEAMLRAEDTIKQLLVFTDETQRRIKTDQICTTQSINQINQTIS